MARIIASVSDETKDILNKMENITIYNLYNLNHGLVEARCQDVNQSTKSIECEGWRRHPVSSS